MVNAMALNPSLTDLDEAGLSIHFRHVAHVSQT